MGVTCFVRWMIRCWASSVDDGKRECGETTTAVEKPHKKGGWHGRSPADQDTRCGRCDVGQPKLVGESKRQGVRAVRESCIELRPVVRPWVTRQKPRGAWPKRHAKNPVYTLYCSTSQWVEKATAGPACHTASSDWSYSCPLSLFARLPGVSHRPIERPAVGN